MAGIPQNFQSISPVIANYDFIDIASGTGYINFYAGNTVDQKLLSNFTYYSDAIVDTTTLNTGGGAAQKLYDHDYDTILNRPMDIQGLGIVNVPLYCSDGSSRGEIYAIAILRKVTGGVESDIVSNQSTTKKNSYTMASIDLTIPITHYKIGDTLRLTIEIWARTTVSIVLTFAYAHDPMSRTTDWDTSGEVSSKLMFQCPVRLNL